MFYVSAAGLQRLSWKRNC